MSDKSMTMLLETGLFADGKTLSTTIRSNTDDDVKAIRIVPDQMDQDGWRDVIRAIKNSGRVIVL